MIDWDNPLQVPFNTPQPLHSPPKREIYNFKKLKEFTLEPMFMEGCCQLSLDTLLTLDIRLLSTFFCLSVYSQAVCFCACLWSHVSFHYIL